MSELSLIHIFGGVDILVNNAGIVRDSLVLSMKEEDFDAVISTNLKGAFNLIKHTYSHFMRKRSGRIINISSVSGLMGNAGQANYSAAKEMCIRDSLYGRAQKAFEREISRRFLREECQKAARFKEMPFRFFEPSGRKAKQRKAPGNGNYRFQALLTA